MPPPLPNELWDRILPDLSRADLASFSRACTRCRAVAEPHLYRNIVWTQAENVPVSDTKPRLDLILRSIITRPDLGKLVRSVKIHQQDPEDRPSRAARCLWHGDASLKRVFTLGEIAAIENLIDIDSLRGAWKQGEVDLIAALLLSKLSVSKVDLSGITRQERQKSRTVLRDALARSLHNLQEVSLCGYSFWDTDRSLLFSEDIAYLFESGTIRLLRMRFTKVDPGVWPGTQPITPTLRTLVIEKGFVTDNHLRDILAATPNLKTLDCCLVFDANRNESCDCATLQLALENIRLSVENLRICIDYWVSDDVAMELGQGEYGIIGHVGSLTNFPRIKNLEFPLVALLGYDPESAPRLSDVLPNMLDTVCIRDDMANFDDFEWSVDGILSKCVEYLGSQPSVNSRFMFKNRMLGSSFRVEQEEELLQVAAEEGIGCSILGYEQFEEEEAWYAQFLA